MKYQVLQHASAIRGGLALRANMRAVIFGIGAATLIGSTLLQADEQLKGLYKGDFIFQGDATAGLPFPVAVTLEITNVTDGKVAGKYLQLEGSCRGEYPVSGIYRDGKLELQAGEGGLRGCGNYPLALALQSGKLVGTHRGQFPLELKREK